MFKTIRAPLVPTVILIGELIVAKQEWATDMTIGLLIGFTGFWVAASLLSNKAIVKRFPWIRDWAPFLDPLGGMATELELMSNHVQGKTFRLTDVAHGGVVKDRTFDNCVIHGPAVLAACGATVMRAPKLAAQRGDYWYQLDDMKVRTGMIVVEDCTFNGCSFCDIGIAGDDRAGFESNFEQILKD